MAAIHLPILVPCEPLRARLSAQACAERWRVANGLRPMRGPTRGHNLVRGSDTSTDLTDRLRASPCRGCAVGASRAAEG